MAAHGQLGLLQVYRDIPIITRTFTTACLLITLATNFEFISQFHIYLNPTLVFERHQYWRIITTFLYAGDSSFGTAFTLLFSYRYSRILEEGSFHCRSADYCFMLFFLTFSILFLSVTFTNLVFLGHSLTHAILYLWCRRNPNTVVMIFGLITLQANLVPFLLICLSLLTESRMTADLVAFAAGHLYYFLEDVFPKQRVGFRILKTPRILKILFNELTDTESNAQLMIDVVDENNNNLVNNNDGLGNPAGEAAALLDNGDNQLPIENAPQLGL